MGCARCERDGVRDEELGDSFGVVGMVKEAKRRMKKLDLKPR